MTADVGNESETFADGPRLLADIGGTHARFAMEHASHRLSEIRVYPCNGFETVEAAIARYLAEIAESARGVGVPIAHAAIAIANPVDGDTVRMTNFSWQFSIEATRRRFGFETLLVVNDFTALAMALPRLRERERRPVGRAVGTKGRADHVIGVIGAGTGLGASALIRTRDRWIALGSEAGHASFAPADDRELRVLEFAKRQWAHVSFERIAGGPGIALIHQALTRGPRARGTAPPDVAEIVQRAHAGERAALETIDCFCAVLGTFAGNVALSFGALGGLYVGGGVVPRLGALFERSSFRTRFEAKGRFNDYLAQIPTFLIDAEHPSFLGVSAILSEHLAEGRGGQVAFFARIRESLDRLSPAERRVADLSLLHPRSVMSDPVARIAERAGVSQPTVIRFCRSMGCEGLSDFKLKLATQIKGTVPVAHSQVRLGDPASEFGAKVLDNTVSAILQLRERLNFAQVEKAIRGLLAARRIEIYGQGSSAVVAHDAHYKFLRLGVSTIAYSDLHLQTASVPLLGAGDVIIVISRSGRLPGLLPLLERASDAGVLVIGITSRHSPLARKASVVLETDPIELGDNQLPMMSRVLHLLIIDVLAVGVAMRRAPGERLENGQLLDWLSHGSAGSSPGAD
ncbi:glucokinase [Robbsia sp. Bb-Pol-6]|uniref:Glucokinase n=1 Tax=Robbsia betulipollinis TaxID=2981849 RepID=A0ABT3ZIX8_9BURK|nr:glucokinase [Robbsia betulipollinis]